MDIVRTLLAMTPALVQQAVKIYFKPLFCLFDFIGQLFSNNLAAVRKARIYEMKRSINAATGCINGDNIGLSHARPYSSPPYRNIYFLLKCSLSIMAVVGFIYWLYVKYNS